MKPQAKKKNDVSGSSGSMKHSAARACALRSLHHFVVQLLPTGQNARALYLRSVYRITTAFYARRLNPTLQIPFDRP